MDFTVQVLGSSLRGKAQNVRAPNFSAFLGLASKSVRVQSESSQTVTKP